MATDTGTRAVAEVAAEEPVEEVSEALEELLPLVVGWEALERGAIWERLALAVQWAGTPEPAAAAMLSALDLGLWSLAGQAAALPVYALLGGRYLRQVDTYAFYNPEQHRGAPPGGVLVEAAGDPERAVARVEDLRRRWGDAARLWVDFGEALSDPEAAASYAQRLQAAEVFCWLEAFPARFVREYQAISPQAEVPLGAGSALTGLKGFLRLLEGKCLDLLAVDIQRIGGLTGAQRIAHLAAVYQLPVALRGGRWGPTLRAVAHLAATGGVYLPVARGEKLEDGFLRLPEEPGWGVGPEEEWLEGYTVMGGS